MKKHTKRRLAAQFSLEMERRKAIDARLFELQVSNRPNDEQKSLEKRKLKYFRKERHNGKTDLKPKSILKPAVWRPWQSVFKPKTLWSQQWQHDDTTNDDTELCAVSLQECSRLSRLSTIEQQRVKGVSSPKCTEAPRPVSQPVQRRERWVTPQVAKGKNRLNQIFSDWNIGDSDKSRKEEAVRRASLSSATAERKRGELSRVPRTPSLSPERGGNPSKSKERRLSPIVILNRGIVVPSSLCVREGRNFRSRLGKRPDYTEIEEDDETITIY